ncbi:hypothetical protein QYF61_003000 [Mycteria americana]|uniref:Uncharacterized protein n=1 Tax=Mycteria americana TaxID=33587 RepID=A0AAN7MUT1_MYCAM|nr:hypothetical protein QYF61_003000 [Mycteria americana]
MASAVGRAVRWLPAWLPSPLEAARSNHPLCLSETKYECHLSSWPYKLPFYHIIFLIVKGQRLAICKSCLLYPNDYDSIQLGLATQGFGGNLDINESKVSNVVIYTCEERHMIGNSIHGCYSQTITLYTRDPMEGVQAVTMWEDRSYAGGLIVQTRMHRYTSAELFPIYLDANHADVSSVRLEYRRPGILCILDSKTLRVDLKSPLSTNHLMDGNQGVSVGANCCWCTVVVAIGTCCSSTLSNATTEGSFKRPGKAKQPQFPQPLLIRLVLQTLYHLRCPSLDTLQHLNVFLVVRGPKLNTVFEVWPHQCRVQGHDHFPTPAGHTISDRSQDAIGLLGHLGTLLAHIQLAVDHHPQVLFHRAAFQPLFPKPVALHGVVVTQVQDPALGLVEPHRIGPNPWIQPVQIPLQSLPTLKEINTPAQLGVICKLTEGALDPLVQIIDKDIKQDWPQHRALGNSTCDRPPTGVNSIHHNSLGPAVQPVLYPVKCTPIQAMSSQFLQENAVRNGVKGFTKV